MTAAVMGNVNYASTAHGLRPTGPSGASRLTLVLCSLTSEIGLDWITEYWINVWKLKDINWHIGDKPKEDGLYLVCYKYEREGSANFEIDSFSNGSWLFNEELSPSIVCYAKIEL